MGTTEVTFPVSVGGQQKANYQHPHLQKLVASHLLSAAAAVGSWQSRMSMGAIFFLRKRKERAPNRLRRRGG